MNSHPRRNPSCFQRKRWGGRCLTALAVMALFALLSASAQAAVVLSGGGLVLIQQGPAAAVAGGSAPTNLATGATAISHGQLSGFGHLTAELNDGLYGNAFSWIGDGVVPASGPYAGISLGAAPVQGIQSFAFGRSNVLSGDPCLGGVCTDRTLGFYSLQYTQLPNPTGTEAVTGNAATGWATVGTLDYQSAGGTNFTLPHQRHRFNFDNIDATGLRLIVPASGVGGGTAIDEFEIYAPITFNPAPGFAIAWDGNDGANFNPNVPATVPDNLALASNGSTAFGSGQLTANGGIHDIDNVIDGVYGNSNSWIHGAFEIVSGVAPGTFVGVDFQRVLLIDAIAFGRDNGNGDIDDSPSGTDGCGGQCDDRSLGSYLKLTPNSCRRYSVKPAPTTSSTPNS